MKLKFELSDLELSLVTGGGPLGFDKQQQSDNIRLFIDCEIERAKLRKTLAKYDVGDPSRASYEMQIYSLLLLSDACKSKISESLLPVVMSMLREQLKLGSLV